MSRAMAEHYGIKEASEMLSLSEKEVFEAIRDGLLPAKLENNEWRIPDWGIRAFLRMRKVLDKIEGQQSDQPLAKDPALEVILNRIDLILEQTQQEKIIMELIRQNEELTKKILELEDALKARDVEIERLKTELLEKLMERENALRKSFEEEKRVLEEQIKELEQKLSLRQARDEHFQDYFLPAETSRQGKEEEGFWRRFVKMLTWD
jgi:DNA repair exonuclease SbcCD ATPase subunit